jgi:hypothetical protein
MFQDAIYAGIKLESVYEPFMIHLMDELCLKSTLLILKDSWQKHLAEFDRSNDIPNVMKILEQFPATINQDNIEDLRFLCIEMFGGVQKACNQDVRALALGIFERMWVIGRHFFENPPRVFYEKSRQFFNFKLYYVENYECLEPSVKEMIQNGNMPCFGKEERRLLEVQYWRELYVKKIREYIEQPEEWRLWSAINHTYFINGMRKAMTPPEAIPEAAQSHVMLLPDEDLNETTEDYQLLMEKERRRCAREALFIIAQRWDFDLF